MNRRSIRRGLGTAILAAALLPQASWGQGLPLPGSRDAAPLLESWTGWSGLWDLFLGTVARTGPKNRGSIDPNGDPTESQTTTPSAPTDPTSSRDNRGSIDPDG